MQECLEAVREIIAALALLQFWSVDEDDEVFMHQYGNIMEYLWLMWDIYLWLIEIFTPPGLLDFCHQLYTMAASNQSL